MGDSSPRQLRAPAPAATAPSPGGRATPIPRLRAPRQIVIARLLPFSPRFYQNPPIALLIASVSRIRLAAFCYSFPAVFSNVETHVHSTQSENTTPHSQLRRCYFRRCDSFHSRRVSPLLARMGLYGHLVRPHPDYLSLFLEARSPVGRAPLAHRGKNHRAENHHSLGPVGCLRVSSDSRIGLPFRLVPRPALADDSFPTVRLRWLSHLLLGHERNQFRLAYRPNRRRAARYFHRPVSPRPPSHVLRCRAYAALHASGAWLLVGAPGLPPRHPADRPPPPQRRKNALPRPPRLFRLLPPHALPPPPPPLVVSFQKSGFAFSFLDLVAQPILAVLFVLPPASPPRTLPFYFPALHGNAPANAIEAM